jgi:hypothetical protein
MCPYFTLKRSEPGSSGTQVGVSNNLDAVVINESVVQVGSIDEEEPEE